MLVELTKVTPEAALTSVSVPVVTVAPFSKPVPVRVTDSTDEPEVGTRSSLVPDAATVTAVNVGPEAPFTVYGTVTEPLTPSEITSEYVPAVAEAFATVTLKVEELFVLVD